MLAEDWGHKMNNCKTLAHCGSQIMRGLRRDEGEESGTASVSLFKGRRAVQSHGVTARDPGVGYRCVVCSVEGKAGAC